MSACSKYYVFGGGRIKVKQESSYIRLVGLIRPVFLGEMIRKPCWFFHIHSPALSSNQEFLSRHGTFIIFALLLVTISNGWNDHLETNAFLVIEHFPRQSFKIAVIHRFLAFSFVLQVVRVASHWLTNAAWSASTKYFRRAVIFVNLPHARVAAIVDGLTCTKGSPAGVAYFEMSNDAVHFAVDVTVIVFDNHHFVWLAMTRVALFLIRHYQPKCGCVFRRERGRIFVSA